MPESTDMQLTSLVDGHGNQTVRVDQADPTVLFGSSLLRVLAANPSPLGSLIDGVLTIRAVNGTWAYRLRDGWADEDGPLQVLGDLIEAP